MEETAREIDRLLNKAYAPATHLAYSQGITAFNNFCRQVNQDSSLPVKPEIVPHFVAYLSLTGKSHSTAKTYLAALAATHKLNGLPDPTDSFLVKKLMQGFSRSTPSSDARLPITFARLKQLISCLETVCKNSYETKLFKAAFTMAFFGFFRVSELVGQTHSHQLSRPGIQSSDIHPSLRGFEVKLRGSKTDQEKKGQSVFLDLVVDSPDVCPVRAIMDFKQIRQNSKDVFLVHMNSAPLSRYQFQAVLKKAAAFLNWPSKGYSSHSFRIGAATTAAGNGTSLESIMQRGRWRSGAVKSYIRLDKI